MKLTRVEQETIINFNEAEGTASIYTHNAALKTRLLALYQSHSAQVWQTAHFFGMPYDWFLEDGDGRPDADDLAVKLGLSPETVETLLDMVSEGGNEAVLEAVDNTLCAALSVIDGVFDDLDRFVGHAMVRMEESDK